MYYLRRFLHDYFPCVKLTSSKNAPRRCCLCCRRLRRGLLRPRRLHGHGSQHPGDLNLRALAACGRRRARVRVFWTLSRRPAFAYRRNQRPGARAEGFSVFIKIWLKDQAMRNFGPGLWRPATVTSTTCCENCAIVSPRGDVMHGGLWLRDVNAGQCMHTWKLVNTE